MVLKVLAELYVLPYHAVLRERANEEQSDQRAENRKAATDPERPGVATVRVWAAKVCGWVRTTNPRKGRGHYIPSMITGKATRRPEEQFRYTHNTKHDMDLHQVPANAPTLPIAAAKP